MSGRHEAVFGGGVDHVVDETEFGHYRQGELEWVEILFAHRVIDPVEHSGEHFSVVDERRDVGVGVGHAWVDVGIQVEVHPIGGQHYPRVGDRGKCSGDV